MGQVIGSFKQIQKLFFWKSIWNFSYSWKKIFGWEFVWLGDPGQSIFDYFSLPIWCTFTIWSWIGFIIARHCQSQCGWGVAIVDYWFWWSSSLVWGIKSFKMRKAHVGKPKFSKVCVVYVEILWCFYAMLKKAKCSYAKTSIHQKSPTNSYCSDGQNSLVD